MKTTSDTSHAGLGWARSQGISLYVELFCYDWGLTERAAHCQGSGPFRILPHPLRIGRPVAELDRMVIV